METYSENEFYNELVSQYNNFTQKNLRNISGKFIFSRWDNAFINNRLTIGGASILQNSTQNVMGFNTNMTERKIADLIQVIVSVVLDLATQEYSTQIQRIGNDTKKLRNWLDEAQKSNTQTKQEAASLNTKQEKTIREQERIIKEKDEAISKKNKEISNLGKTIAEQNKEITDLVTSAKDLNKRIDEHTEYITSLGKKPCKENRNTNTTETQTDFSGVIPDDYIKKREQRKKSRVNHVIKRVPVEEIENSRNFNNTRLYRMKLSEVKREILLYDIPARLNNEEIVKLLNQLGKIHKMTIKRHYKYYSVKVQIQLNSDYERKFLNNDWQIEIGKEKRMLLRWFPGSMTLWQRKSRDKHQLIKDISKFPVQFTTDNYNVNKEDATILKHIYEEYNIKCVKTVRTPNKKKIYLIVCCEKRIDRNTLYNTKSDWMFFNRNTLENLLRKEQVDPRITTQPPKNNAKLDDRDNESSSSMDFTFTPSIISAESLKSNNMEDSNKFKNIYENIFSNKNKQLKDEESNESSSETSSNIATTSKSRLPHNFRDIARAAIEEAKMKRRDRTDKEKDIDVYGNREGRHNKLKKLAQPK